MRYLRPYVFTLFYSFLLINSYAFKTNKVPVFKLSGRLLGINDGRIVIVYDDEVHLIHKEYSIPVHDGNFEFVTADFITPRIVSFKSGEIDFGSLLVAPGYALNVSADTRDPASMLRSIQFKGKGCDINIIYRMFMLEGIKFSRCLTSKTDKSVPECLSSQKQSADSLFKVASHAYGPGNDPYYHYFMGIIAENLRYAKFTCLLNYLKAAIDTYTVSELDSILQHNTDSGIFESISAPYHLRSPQYLNLLVVEFSHLFYLAAIDKKRGLNTNGYQYYLPLINKTYSGLVRNFVLFKFLNLNLVAATNSYEGFMAKKSIWDPYLKYLRKSIYYKPLINSLREKEIQLSKDRIGTKAPFFNLKDSSYHDIKLTDFKGKVIVLDFWASWYSPCRKETPFFKKIVQNYKNDARITFISIAVNDKLLNWKNALIEDSPEWLQLLDNGEAAKAYITNLIPKFVVIDKRGLIVNFQAPYPSEGSKLECILSQEIIK